MKIKTLILLAFVAVVGLLPQAQAILSVDLGSASSFAVLAGSTITDAGGSTIVSGNVGLYSGTSIGLTAGQVLGGTIYAAGTGFDLLLIGAKNDLVTAYNTAAAQLPVSTVGTELGASSLGPGVYDSAAGTFGITGALTLNAGGDPNAVFIFKMASTLITASGSLVDLIGGAQACNVFWQVGSSATLGTDSSFVGNILALTSITVNSGATVDGRVLARNGAVSLDNSSITEENCTAFTAPDPGSTLLLLSSGLATLLAFRRRFFSAA